MAFCTLCAAQIADDDEFCRQCGKSINATPTNRDPLLPPPLAPNGQSPKKKNLALRAHLWPLVIVVFTFFFGGFGYGQILIFFAWLPPLLIMNNKDNDEFTREHAKESVNFQLFWLAASLILLIALGVITSSSLDMGLLLFFPGLVLVAVFELIVMISAISAASSGRSYRYPGVLIRFVK